MYIVQWCGHDGNLKQRFCKNLYAAKAEARYLLHSCDGVEIVTPDGKRLWPAEQGPAEKQR